VIHGAADQMTPSMYAHTLADRIRGARVYMHPTGRHGFFDEFADDLQPILQTFWG
jgi:hypothetical protein